MHQGLRFGCFELQPGHRELRLDGERVALGARAFDTLCHLVLHRHRVVSRGELLDTVWAGLVVEENNLSVQISTLRKVLGEATIATVAGKGYQFTAAVDSGGAPSPAPIQGAEPIDEVAPIQDAAYRSGGESPDADLNAVQDGPTLVLLATPDAAPTSPARVVQIAREHGATLEQAAGNHVVLRFVQPHSALACARRLVAGVDISAAGARVSICHAHEIVGRAALDRSSSLMVMDSMPERPQTMLSPSVAGVLVDGVDAQLESLGEAAFGLGAWPPAARQAAEPAPVDDRPAIAVLPFQDYRPSDIGLGLGDVIADQLIASLSAGHDLRVISRLSTRAFGGRAAPLAQMAQQLRARYIASGRFRHEGSRVAVDVELADATDGSVLWTHVASDEAAAVMEPDSLLMLELSTGLTQAVMVSEIRRQPVHAMPNIRSQALLLGAIDLMFRLAPRDIQRAKGVLDTLHQRAPRSVPPLAWLSRWHLFRVVQGRASTRDEDGRLALGYAEQALDLEPRSSLALTMLGNAYTNYRRDPEGGCKLYDQALGINPNESIAWLQKGNALSFMGDGRGGMSCIERALSLSPLDPARHFYRCLHAGAALSAGEYEQAVKSARESLRLNRDHVSTHRVLTIALSLLGRMEEARRAAAVLLRLEPTLTVSGFIGRSPGSKSGLASRFGEALQQAGVPLN